MGRVEVVWPVGCELGEGPMWDHREKLLWFVDIKRGHVHRLDPATEARRTIEVGGLPCFLLPSDDGGYVLGNGHDLLRFDGDQVTGRLAHVTMPEDNRFNDATVDPQGRIWFGSMDNREVDPTGAVHVLDRGQVQVAGGQCCITNGPAVSSDARWLYHVDTVAGLIWRFDISASIDLRDGEVFVRIAPEDGHPDGVTIDAENHLWVGLWGGWCARRYAPDGRQVAEVWFPVANVTKVAFGGPDLRTAYATTARQGLTTTDVDAQPLAGSIFSFHASVPGVRLPVARLT